MSTKTLKATCLCGSAKHEIILPESELPLKLYICHCTSCRRMTGTLHLTTANLPESYAPSPDLIAKLTPFQFSKRLTQYFCSICGTHMLAYVPQGAYDETKGSQWDVLSGTLERFNDTFEIDSHQCLADTLDGGFSDFLPVYKGKSIPRFAGFINESEELALYWSSQERPKVKPSPSDKLHCHCKCGGVNFWIARPSERSKQACGAWPDLIIPHYSNQRKSDQSAWWLRDNGTKFLAGVCSCNSCRLDTGMEWIEWAFVPTVDISLDAEGDRPFVLPFGSLKSYQSSHDVTRYHCGTCGASVFFTCEERVDLIDIAVGLLDAPEGARAENWLEFRTQRLSFREDAIPRAEDLTLAVEHGLEKFGERRQNSNKPFSTV